MRRFAVIAVFVVAFLASALPGELAEAQWCTWEGIPCSCNCPTFEQECQECASLGGGWFCKTSFYSGYCSCDADGTGCGISGTCCVWV